MAFCCNTNPCPSLGEGSLENYCPCSLLGPLVLYKCALDVKHTNSPDLREPKKLHAPDDVLVFLMQTLNCGTL